MMSIISHIALALQPDPRMVRSLIKMGAFQGGRVSIDEKSCSQLVIEKLLLFEAFERFVPAFFNPDLKFFLLTVVWDDYGNFYVTPSKESAPSHQFIFGKKNSRRLKAQQLNLLGHPLKGNTNLASWAMEIKEGCRFEDIGFDKILYQINSSTFRNLLRTSAAAKVRPEPALLRHRLGELRKTLLKLKFIADLHPVLEFSEENTKLFNKRNDFVEVVLKT